MESQTNDQTITLEVVPVIRPYELLAATFDYGEAPVVTLHAVLHYMLDTNAVDRQRSTNIIQISEAVNTHSRMAWVP